MGIRRGLRDEGLTGTKESRPEFQRPLRDCRAGKIDLIRQVDLPSSRNTVTMLPQKGTERAGIDVFFEKENIHSMSDGELMLSILASLRGRKPSVSENQKWRIRKLQGRDSVGTFILQNERRNFHGYSRTAESSGTFSPCS